MTATTHRTAHATSQGTLSPLSLYLRKRLKVCVPRPERVGPSNQSKALVVSIQKNIESLGFSFSRRLALALSKQGEEFLTAFYKELVPELRRQKGAHVAFRPMYPNFPAQVINMTDLELYWNAIYHYLTLDDPNTQEKEERLPLDDSEGTEKLVIDLGSQADYEAILTSLAGANASLSNTDKETLVYLLTNLPEKSVAKLLPAVIPQRETLALVASVLLKKDAGADINAVAKTATDVLRVATQLCGGDISLAENAKYGKIARATRRSLLAALEACGPTLEEDMLRHKGKWLRLGETLHPGQYATRYPRAATAMDKLRQGTHIPTFASKTEAAIAQGDWKGAVELLSQRPGQFLRRLDQLLRLPEAKRPSVIVGHLAKVIDRCATPALLGTLCHFQNRGTNKGLRAVFPKGSTAKIKVINHAKPLPEEARLKAVETIEAALLERFAKLDPLGKVYVAPELANYPVPFAQRSASKTLRTLPRGSRAPIQGDGDILRFFIHWKNTGPGWEGRVDIDLSCAFLTEEFTLAGRVSYYNLSEYGGHHSGDIVDAPEGASEFIDISMEKLLSRGVRYVVPTVTSFTKQAYRDLPECFCGWMLRQNAQRGEIFEARTVTTKSDLAGDTRFAVPVLIDIKERQAIWVDLGLNNNPDFVNALDCNKRSLSLLCKAMVELKRPTLATLASLHATARGKLVKDPKKADVIFGPELAYEGDKIASELLQ
jgi:hypothetical protein